MPACLQGYWSDFPSSAFAKLPKDTIAVLPIGATEQHGPHLPLCVDSALIDVVIKRSLPMLPSDVSALVLPRLSITKSGEHDRHPGTLSLSPETLLAVLRDIAASVSRARVSRLVLFNGHGGNTAALEVAVREMRVSHGLIAVHCSWFGFADFEDHIEAQALAHDIHAGFVETSAMLSAHPELVDMNSAAHFHTAMAHWPEQAQQVGLSGQPARPGWIIDDLNPEGACGNAAAATVDAGEAMLHSAALGFAKFLAAFSQFDHRAETR